MRTILKIAVIDGQGGGIGKAIVEKIRAKYANSVEILALGTNALATALMLKSGANEGASGENAIFLNVGKVDLIIGSLGIILANSMLGELTPKMAEAIANSSAKKILIPLNRCNILVVGVKNESIPYYVDEAVELINNYHLK